MNLIKKILLLFCILSSATYAAQVWVTDDLRTGVLQKPSDLSGLSGTLVAGETVEKIGASKDGKYIHIRKGTLEGWVRSQNIMTTPSIRASYDEQTKQLQQLKAQTQALSGQTDSNQQKLTQLNEALKAAKSEAQKTKNDFLQLQRVSKNVVEIDQLNKTLQSQLAVLQQNNLLLSQQNNQLQSSNNQREMIIGGVLALGGMLLFWILSAFSHLYRRRSSFDDF